MKRLTWILPALLLLGCSEVAQVPANTVDNAVDLAVEATRATDAAAVDVQEPVDSGAASVGNAASTFALAMTDVAESITSDVLPPPPRADKEASQDPAVDLMIRWEVTSQAHYMKSLQGLICPGGKDSRSGPTGGIGYDFGQQTEAEIRRVWGWHPDVDRLATASGQNGHDKCTAWRNAHRDIRITFDQAKRVFLDDSLPKYRRMAIRALPGLERQTKGYIGGLTSTGYRRGWAMEGPRMIEKRVIKAKCVPHDDAPCGATQVLSMCRLWRGTSEGNGQCARGEDEARVIQS